MKKHLALAAAIALAACDKDKITGCVTCRTDTYEINTLPVPNESKNIGVKHEDACGDAQARALIDKFTQGQATRPNWSTVAYRVDTNRKGIIYQEVTRCEEK